MVQNSYSYTASEQFEQICEDNNCPLTKEQKVLLYSFLSQFYYHLHKKGEMLAYNELKNLVESYARVLLKNR